MKALYLILQRDIFCKIESGEVTELYLSINPYWSALLLGKPVLNRKCEVIGSIPAAEWEFNALTNRGGDVISEIWKGNLVVKNFERAVLSCQYWPVVSSRPSFIKTTFRIKGIIVGKGRRDWGAPEENVFIIKLGDRV